MADAQDLPIGVTYVEDKGYNARIEFKKVKYSQWFSLSEHPDNARELAIKWRENKEKEFKVTPKKKELKLSRQLNIVDGKINLHVKYSQSESVHEVNLETKLTICVTAEAVCIVERSGKYRVRSFLMEYVVSANAKNEEFKSKSSTYKTLEEAENVRAKIEEKMNNNKKQTLVVTVGWLLKQNQKKLDKHIRLAEHPGKIDYLPSYSQPLLLDCTALGIWLGDGSSANSNITNIDQEIVKYIQNYAERLGLCYERSSDDPSNDQFITFHINEKRSQYSKVKDFDQLEQRKLFVHYFENNVEIELKDFPNKYNWLQQLKEKGKEKFLHYNHIFLSLKKYNLINNKHIPEVYLKASRDERLRLLGGLISTDGYRETYTFEICQKNVVLAANIVTLCQSLGFFIDVVDKIAIATNAKNHEGTLVKRMKISGAFLHEVPCLIPKKQIPIFKPNQTLPRISFMKIKDTKEENVIKRKRRRNLDWGTDEIKLNNDLIGLYKKHKHGKNVISKILHDPQMADFFKRKEINRNNIRDKLKRLNCL